ncbi:histidine kinase [Nocardioides baekrokdamisoli]|uniref:Histidine kinase n=2 Tax=Nocardioides baekrokdamisoli TaxID=1804624 RepID=A0A3G9IRD6_9ACTN|nr:histidine kinase [Nocardioides baekrokdamisoli]
MTSSVDIMAPTNQPRWLGPWFASIWLLYLLDPLIYAIQQHKWIGAGATVAFGIWYVGVWIWARQLLHRRITPLRATWPQALVSLGVLIGFGVLMVALIGPKGLAASVYIAVLAIMLLPPRFGIAVAVLDLVAVLSMAFRHGWDSAAGGVGLGVIAASIAVFGIRTVITRNFQLIEAHQENADLAVENERTRFARDLHDILGHSLTVITVKAELAQRLFDVDPVRAREELADLERLSRDALADVRRAVRGYRELTLPNELARARQALNAAGIEPVLPQSTDAVPTELRELFAWTVREGITNVLRHSHATQCEIVLSDRNVEVRDNGRGCDCDTVGSGLTGLRERARANAATVTTRNLTPGFVVEVAVR